MSGTGGKSSGGSLRYLRSTGEHEKAQQPDTLHQVHIFRGHADTGLLPTSIAGATLAKLVTPESELVVAPAVCEPGKKARQRPVD